MLVSEFTIEDPETRARMAAEAKEKLAALESGDWDGTDEDPNDGISEDLLETLGEVLENEEDEDQATEQTLRTPEGEKNLYEKRFTQRNNRLFEKLILQI